MILPCADMLLLVPQNQSPLDGKSDEQIEEQARADLAQRAERQKRARPESDVPINDEIEYVHRHSPLFAAYCASCHPHALSPSIALQCSAQSGHMQGSCLFTCLCAGEVLLGLQTCVLLSHQLDGELRGALWRLTVQAD